MDPAPYLTTVTPINYKLLGPGSHQSIYGLPLSLYGELLAVALVVSLPLRGRATFHAVLYLWTGLNACLSSIAWNQNVVERSPRMMPGLVCPHCKSIVAGGVLDTTKVENGVRRRHRCGACGETFPTLEQVGVKQLMVVKTDGNIERFKRKKIRKGIKRAYYVKDSKVEDAYIENMTNFIVNKILSWGKDKVTSDEIGRIVLQVLFNDSREESRVALIRFACVFLSIRNAEGLNRLGVEVNKLCQDCLLYTSPSPRDS